MFKHILIPTDGSALSKKAVRSGLKLAAKIGAKVTGFHVVEEFRAFTINPDMLEATRDEYKARAVARAKEILDEVRKLAQQAKVDCGVEFTSNAHPYLAIIRAARRKRCDLILMASHGRGGLQGLLLGSETHKVLTHSSMPVLVYR